MKAGTSERQLVCLSPKKQNNCQYFPTSRVSPLSNMIRAAASSGCAGLLGCAGLYLYNCCVNLAVRTAMQLALQPVCWCRPLHMTLPLQGVQRNSFTQTQCRVSSIKKIKNNIKKEEMYWI